MGWTKKDIENLQGKGIKTNLAEQPKGTKVVKISVEKNTIETVLWVLRKEGVIDNYITEHTFHPHRKFRFDWAITTLKIAIEYEGLISAKSGHTTIKGYSEDCIKYNEAIKLGWRVLRYTALTYGNLQDDLKNLI